MKQIGRLLLGWIGFQTILAGSLLFIAIITIALGLSDLVRGLEPGLTVTTALLALAVAWGIASTRLRPVTGLALLIFAGLSVLVVRLANLGGKVVLAAWALLQPVATVDRWPFEGLPGGILIRDAFSAIFASLYAVFTRFSTWLVGASQGSPVFDPLIPAFLWGMAIWLVSGWAGWALKRGYRGLSVLLPAAGLLAAAFGYSGHNPLYLVAMLSVLLFLTVLIDQGRRERRWQSTGIDFSLEIRVDLALTAGSLAVLLVVLSMIVPFVQPGKLARTVQTYTTARQPGTDTLVRSIGLEPKPAPVSLLYSYYTPGLPRQHLIGSGPELSGRVVMTVAVSVLSQPNWVSGQINPTQGPRLYWRSFTYDRYSGYGWSTNPTIAADYRPGTQLRETDPAKEMRIRQEIRGKEDLQAVLFQAGEILTVDHPFRIERRSDPDVFAGIVKSNTYRVESSLPDTRPETLSRSGRTYPAWVKSRYLQLPENISARVLGLARDLTATAITPYDQARAIETYLQQIPYTLDLPAPPGNKELSDYFLFQLKEGYCDYYATAMVVLARAAGLPARLATGYATGTDSTGSGVYTVTEADAHSWPEIYFPGSGWVAFEPTAALTSRTEAQGFAPISPNIPTPGAAQPSGQPGSGHSQAPLAILLGGIVVLLLTFGLVSRAIRKRRHSQKPATPLQALEGWYRSMCREGSWLGVAIRKSDTPLEASAKLADRLEQILGQGNNQKPLQPAAADISALVDGYIQSAYSPKMISPDDLTRLKGVWSRLRFRLWLAWLSSSLNRSRNRL